MELQIGLSRIAVRRPFVDGIHDQQIVFAGERVVGTVRGRGQPVLRVGVQPGEPDPVAPAVANVASGMGKDAVRSKSLIRGSSGGKGVAEE